MLRWIAVVLFVGTSLLPAASPSAADVARGYREGVVIAQPRGTVGAQSQHLRERAAGFTIERSYPRLGGLRIIRGSDGESVPELLARVKASGQYSLVEPDYVRRSSVTPNDPRFASGTQWGLRNPDQDALSQQDINAVAGWAIRHDAADVIVAVIDSGMRLTHEDLVENLWTNPAEIPGNGIDDDRNGYIDDVHGINVLADAASERGDPTDDNGHGTHVAGIIGARGNNGIGIAGVAWTVQLMPLKFLDEDGDGFSSGLVECIDYAIAHGAHIINASFGSDGFSSVERAAIARARDAGIVFVAAAGNEGLNLDEVDVFPATYALDNIITVAAGNRDGNQASFSNYGRGRVDLVAPGEDILSTGHGSDTSYRTMSGTSMATPHVSGALALLRAQYPDDDYRRLINRLLQGTSGHGSFWRTHTAGYLDLGVALQVDSTRPFNDNHASSSLLEGRHIFARASNRHGTRQDGEPLHAGGPGGASLWWRWRATSTARITIDTARSEDDNGDRPDTRLAVYTGGHLTSLVEVAADDNSGPGRTSSVSFLGKEGMTYSIAADTRFGTPAVLGLNLRTVPTNDDLADAQEISGRSVRLTGDNIGAGSEAGEPRVAGTGSGATVWYRWTAPESRRFQVSVAGADRFALNLNPVVGIYQGDTVAELELVAGNDDAPTSASTTVRHALATFDAVAGRSYAIAVDTRGDPGTFSLILVDSVWQMVTGGAVVSSPSVGADGRIYIGSTDTYLYAVEPDGTVAWRYATGDLIDVGSPSIDGQGNVYIGSHDSYLHAVRPNGTRAWRYNSSGAVVNSAAIDADGLAYFRSGDGYLYGLNARGSRRWRQHVGTESYGSPAIGLDGTIYVGGNGSAGLSAFAPDGTKRWQFRLDGDVYTAPAIGAAGNLYVGTLAGTLYSVSPEGAVRWKNTVSSSITSTPALHNGTVYFGGYDNAVHALAIEDGAVRWRFDLPDEIRASSPAIAEDGSILIGCYDGNLYHLEPDGTLRRTYATGGMIRSSPVIANDHVYVGSSDGKLYAFDLGQSAAQGDWPMFQRDPARTGRAPDAPATPRLGTGPVPTGVKNGVLTLSAVAEGTDLSYQWYRDGAAIEGATTAAFTDDAFTAAKAGLYQVSVSNSAGSITSSPVMAAPILTEPGAVAGDVSVVLRKILHPQTLKEYDQLILTGRAGSFTSLPDRVTRLSFIDLSDDIVQLEFTGPGTVTIALEGIPEDPAEPTKYNQPGVFYTKGHARVLVMGATEDSHLSIFSVGKANAVNQTLFPPGEVYDGVADVALLAVSSASHAFGSISCGNAHFFSTTGHTGLFAPDIDFRAHVRIHDITADDAAVPVALTGTVNEIGITGGSLDQLNGAALEVGDAAAIRMMDGGTSHGDLLPRQTNQARLTRDGVDVTAALVINPN